MFCPNCGKDAGESKFCPECGYDMSRTKAPQQQSQPKYQRVGAPVKKKKPIIPIVLVVLFLGGFAVAISQTGSTSGEPVAQVFDATRFLVTEGEETRPMTETELIAELGEPEETEDWSYSYGSTEYPVRTLYYHDGKYDYVFYNGELSRIHIWVPAVFENKREIPEMYNLSGGSVIADTPAAYRVENCGVHDLWCFFGDEDGTIDSAYISYTNFFDNPYDPVMKGDGQRPPNLQVLDADSVTEGYLRYITGHIVNNSSKTYSYVQVSIGLYNGEVLVGSTLDNVNNLAPGSTWEFKAIVTEDSATQFKIEEVTGW